MIQKFCKKTKKVIRYTYSIYDSCIDRKVPEDIIKVLAEEIIKNLRYIVCYARKIEEFKKVSDNKE